MSVDPDYDQPPAYGGCHCWCHHGLMHLSHVAPCCSPSLTLPPEPDIPKLILPSDLNKPCGCGIEDGMVIQCWEHFLD